MGTPTPNWIKMRCNLGTDPRVGRLCDLTGQLEPTVIGGLFLLWAAADQHSEDGFLPGMSRATLDRRCAVAGLAAALEAIGWITVADDGITLVHFDDHNGASAKKRMLTAIRVAKHKSANAPLTQPALATAQDGVSQALARVRDREEIEKSNPVVPSVPAGDAPTPLARTDKQDCPHQEIIALYHQILPQCPQVRGWTAARATALRARWNEDPKRQSLAYWRRFFEYVATCDFLVGRAGKTPFFADLEWITRSANFIKIIEQKYENN